MGLIYGWFYAYDKVWQKHVVREEPDGTALLYIDRHLVHEVTSPQAFDGLTLNKRPLWRKKCILAVPDHNVPRDGILQVSISDSKARLQVETLGQNCETYGLTEFKMISIFLCNIRMRLRPLSRDITKCLRGSNKTLGKFRSCQQK